MSNKRTHRTSLSTSDSSFQFLQASHYRAGELYLFCRTERPYPSSGSLFGIFDKEASGVIYLESSSSDLCHFRLWHRLPRGYRCSRCATRSELRDYIFNLACYEYRHTGHRPELPYENPAPNRPVSLYMPEQYNLRHKSESCFSVIPDTTIAVWSCSQILTLYRVLSWARTAYTLVVLSSCF